ncbi:hypothetical protein [Iodidimonas muriae]|uniref:hypothetical protein n=1 Tax=Iodidimonas muriae TaxID=261467 RepID=UPI0016657491|nr:hypothetical protein [Iodidimonas muriae]
MSSTFFLQKPSDQVVDLKTNSGTNAKGDPNIGFRMLLEDAFCMLFRFMMARFCRLFQGLSPSG